MCSSKDVDHTAWLLCLNMTYCERGQQNNWVVRRGKGFSLPSTVRCKGRSIEKWMKSRIIQFITSSGKPGQLNGILTLQYGINIVTNRNNWTITKDVRSVHTNNYVNRIIDENQIKLCWCIASSGFN